LACPDPEKNRGKIGADRGKPNKDGHFYGVWSGKPNKDGHFYGVWSGRSGSAPILKKIGAKSGQIGAKTLPRPNIFL
jgi:hypothetical protein